MRKRGAGVPAIRPSGNAGGTDNALVVAIDAALVMIADRRWVETEWFHEILGALFAMPDSAHFSTDSHALYDEVADDHPARVRGDDAANLLLDLRIDAATPRLTAV